MMNRDTMNAIITIIKNGRDFYAHDYELNGGTISALARKGLIEKTGNSRSEFVAVGYDNYEPLYRKVEIYEWHVSHKGMKAVAEMARKTANEMLAFAEAVESLC